MKIINSSVQPQSEPKFEAQYLNFDVNKSKSKNQPRVRHSDKPTILRREIFHIPCTNCNSVININEIGIVFIT